MEIWKDIRGYEDSYQVSNLGKVKSKANETILKPDSDKGYYRVTLYKNSKGKHFSIHRLVAEAFIPNINNKPCVNHKDENKTNNSVDNLEWCDVKYNTNYGTCLQRRSKTLVKTLKERDLTRKFEVYKDNIFIGYFESTMDCERELGLDHRHISHCLNGKRKSHKGYKFKMI